MIIGKNIIYGGIKMNKLYISVLMALVSVSFMGCDSLHKTFGLDKPSAQLKNIKFADADASFANLVFDVEIYNPYPAGLPLTNLTYNITGNETNLLSGTTALQTSIAAKGKTMVSLPVKVNYLDLFKSVKGIRPGSTISYKADATLTTAPPLIGNFDIPLKKEGQMDIPEVTSEGIIKLLDKMITK